ncbi:MAG: outer membrane lipoprotein carrier protein LolA [Bacilli bacterium]|nr:outer membrane lipoprotein carrier protein LolA [Bacilli bacterium]
MKKIFICLILICLFLTGCGKQNDKEVLKNFQDKIIGTDSYYLTGEMELVNNEDVYNYKIDVSYKKNDYYKIELTNVINDHKQIILRNNEGVYIVTPSLNKSFKFQSDWPYNNSQVYLLSSLLDDINNDPNRLFENTKDGYIFTSSVNYPNNEKLVKQKVYFDKDYLPTKVEVLNADGNKEISMKFDKIDLKTEFNDTYFDLNSILDTNKVPENTPNENENTPNENQEPSDNNETKETATIDDIIYPMYLPVNTYLTNTERVNTEDGERLILTFSGDSSFVLMEQVAKYSDVPEIIPTYGDVELVGSSLAVVNDNSANWFDNGIEYYIVSDVLSTDELLDVVRSISVLPVSK